MQIIGNIIAESKPEEKPIEEVIKEEEKASITVEIEAPKAKKTTKRGKKND